jgi:hypothetical protein
MGQVDPVLKFVIEAACLIGVVLLAAVSTPVFGGKRWGWAIWLRSSAIVVVGLFYLFVNPRGWPDLFALVLGSTAFVVGVVGLTLALTLVWRLAHRERRTEIDRQTSISFGAMGLFGLAAAACLIGALICAAGIVDGLRVESAYQHAPDCATAPSSDCRSQTDARVVRTWAESSRGRHWIEVSLLGRKQTIELTTATDVWQKLLPGTRVRVTAWKGQVTEVNLAGVGSMDTPNSPNFGLIAAIALLATSLVGLLLFGAGAYFYRLKWRVGLQGIDTSQIAA